ncbi:HSP40/DnaJ peptide-binding protein [Actinidia rufa]|uniref:HSP40/DnaJ peptide-binding protein n=1 Tax=Actinidia rufa TaxID=165716 RepID=A0A7J0EFX0_9ERIC|nr:HSP40/DnaJ peptide-binding protein [Actinidia rufa]
MPVSASRRFLRSMSRKNNVDDAIASPKEVSLSRSTTSTWKASTSVFPEGVSSLSRSTSCRKASTPLSPAGGSLSRSTSSRKLSTAVSAAGGSLSNSASIRKGSAPIMYSNSNGLMKPPAVEKNLECTLEELCFGCVKKIMVARDVVTNDGQVVVQEEMLTIKVKPGWTKGTKITFEGSGKEATGTYPADIIFVIVEKKHSLFRREGDDLEMTVEVPLVKALTGCTLSVPLLGGEKMSLKIDDIIEPGSEKVITGQGMPKPKEHGNRGNLVVKFQVQFPTELTDDQRARAFSILQNSC